VQVARFELEQVPVQVPEQTELVTLLPDAQLLPALQVPLLLELHVPLKPVCVELHVTLLDVGATQSVPDAQAFP